MKHTLSQNLFVLGYMSYHEFMHELHELSGHELTACHYDKQSFTL